MKTFDYDFFFFRAIKIALVVDMRLNGDEMCELDFLSTYDMHTLNTESCDIYVKKKMRLEMYRCYVDCSCFAIIFPQCKHIQMSTQREKHAHTIPLCFLHTALSYWEGKWQKCHYIFEKLSACLIWFSSSLLAAIQKKKTKRVLSLSLHLCTMFPSHTLEKSIHLFIDLMLHWRSIQFSVLFTFVSLSLFLCFSNRSFHPKR